MAQTEFFSCHRPLGPALVAHTIILPALHLAKYVSFNVTVPVLQIQQHLERRRQLHQGARRTQLLRK